MERLSASARFTIVSFEKADRWRAVDRRIAIANRLSAQGITWRPLRYHARPRLLATAWDVAAGTHAVSQASRDPGIALVHCRGEVAMLMARLASLPAGCKRLLDMRGFFAAERVESGSWRAGGLTDRVVRGAETGNLRAADGLVVLTRTGLEVLARGAGPLPPHRVIPTCVDTDRFHPSPAPDETLYCAVYSGSLGTWYMTEEMLALGRVFTQVLGGRALFLTPDRERAVNGGATSDWAEVRTAEPEEVPAWLRRARSAFFLIRPTPAKRASSPTKLGEALATGLPVVANRGIGDVDRVLEHEGVGVLVDSLDDAGYRQAAVKLAALLADPATAGRCRAVAESRFGIAVGTALYRELYDEMEVAI